jgi:hypothetical protein
MTPRGVRWEARQIAALWRPYLVFARLRYPGTVVGPGTELVIDGFTRSGVTFALFAFQMAQPRPVPTAHHTHAASHIIEAVRRRVPTVLVVRDPEETVLSTMIREPYVTPSAALRAYRRFHGRLQPHRDRLLVARFESVMSDLGSVIRDLNARFGTAFEPFLHTADNAARVFRLIEDRSGRPPWAGALGRLENGEIGVAEYERAVASAGGRAALAPLPEHRVPRPSPERQAMKTRLRDRVRAEAELLRAARAAYSAMVPSSDVPADVPPDVASLGEENNSL